MAKVASGRAALGILTGVNVLNYLDRYVGAPVLPLILKDLGLSDSQGGLQASLFIVTYALMSPVAGWLGDRRPRLPIAAAGVLLWSAATVASGLAPTYLALLLARAFIGVGEASYAVVTPSILSDYYPRERRGRVLAVFYAAIPVGSALGYEVGSVIGERYGWRPAFMIAGLPGAVLALALLGVAEPPRGRFDAPAPAGDGARRPLGASLRLLGARRSYLYNTLAQVIYTFTIGGLAVWMPTYFVRARGLGIAQAGTVFGALLLGAGFLGTLAGGQVGDKLAARIPGGHFLLSGWALLASLPFTLLAILHPSPAIFWPAMFVTLFLLFVNTGPLNAAMANVLPADLRAQGFAYYSLAIHLLGDAASPYAIGALSDRVGLKLPVLANGMLLGVAGVVLLLGQRALARDLNAATAVPSATAEPAAALPAGSP